MNNESFERKFSFSPNTIPVNGNSKLDLSYEDSGKKRGLSPILNHFSINQQSSYSPFKSSYQFQQQQQFQEDCVNQQQRVGEKLQIQENVQQVDDFRSPKFYFQQQAGFQEESQIQEVSVEGGGLKKQVNDYKKRLANLSLQKESSKDRLEKITKIERPSTSVQDKYNHFKQNSLNGEFILEAGIQRQGVQSQNDFYRRGGDAQQAKKDLVGRERSIRSQNDFRKGGGGGEEESITNYNSQKNKEQNNSRLMADVSYQSDYGNKEKDLYMLLRKERENCYNLEQKIRRKDKIMGDMKKLNRILYEKLENSNQKMEKMELEKKQYQNQILQEIDQQNILIQQLKEDLESLSFRYQESDEILRQKDYQIENLKQQIKRQIEIQTKKEQENQTKNYSQNSENNQKIQQENLRLKQINFELQTQISKLIQNNESPNNNENHNNNLKRNLSNVQNNSNSFQNNKNIPLKNFNLTLKENKSNSVHFQDEFGEKNKNETKQINQINQNQQINLNVILGQVFAETDTENILKQIKTLLSFYKKHKKFENCLIDMMLQCTNQTHLQSDQFTYKEAWKWLKVIVEDYFLIKKRNQESSPQKKQINSAENIVQQDKQ